MQIRGPARLLPDEVVRRVVDKARLDRAAEHLRQDPHGQEAEEEPVREGEVGRVAHGVEVLRGQGGVRPLGRDDVEAVVRSAELAREDVLGAIQEVAADGVTEADRPGVGHDGDPVGRDAPGVRGLAVQDLLDRLQLDEVVAAADRADLRVAPVRAARALDVVAEGEGAPRGQDALEVHAREVPLLGARVVVAPDAVALVVGRGLEQTPQALAEQRLALPRRHDDVAPALEEHGAQRRVERVQVAGQLVPRDVGDEEAHAAADIVADGLRDDEALGLRHGADRDAGAAVEVGREVDAADGPDGVAPERAGLARALGVPGLLDGALDRDQLERLLDGLELDRDVPVGEEGDGNPVLVRDGGDAVVPSVDERLEAVAAGHDTLLEGRDGALRWSPRRPARSSTNRPRAKGRSIHPTSPRAPDGSSRSGRVYSGRARGQRVSPSRRPSTPVSRAGSSPIVRPATRRPLSLSSRVSTFRAMRYASGSSRAWTGLRSSSTRSSAPRTTPAHRAAAPDRVLDEVGAALQLRGPEEAALVVQRISAGDAVDRLAGEAIGVLVAEVAGVPVHPLPAHASARLQRVEALQQVDVEKRTVLAPPAALLPAGQPQAAALRR